VLKFEIEKPVAIKSSDHKHV